MKKAFLLIFLISLGLSAFSQKKPSQPIDTVSASAKIDTVLNNDSVSFVNYLHVMRLEKALKAVLINPEYIKLDPIDQYNFGIKPIIDAIVAKSKKEWEEKQKEKIKKK